MGEIVHRIEVRNRPGNSKFAMQEEEFRKSYRYERRLVEWGEASEDDPKDKGAAKSADPVAEPPVAPV
jgi:hypothetical protein